MTTIVTDSDELYYELFEGGITFDKKILIEGDSWVSHPQMTNLAGHFGKLPHYNNIILNLAVPGDNAGSVYNSSDAVFRSGGPQMKELKKVLNKTNWDVEFDLIFISAAGNDIIGPEIREIPLVNNKKEHQGSYGRNLLNLNFFAKVHKVIEGYRRFLKMIRNSRKNKNTPVITHAYAYLEPRQVGTHIFGHYFNKGWLAQHLIYQGIKDTDEQYEIIVEMFDRYYQQISAVQQEFSRFLVVDTRKSLLKNGRPNTDWFHDEIHPTSAGFKKVFSKIKKEATNANLWTL